MTARGRLPPAQPGLGMHQRIEVLATTYLLRGLPDAALAPLAEAAHEVRLARGEAAFRVGDPADGVYVVATGLMKESVIDAAGREIVFEVFTRGAVEGEPGTFAFEGDRVVDFVAVEDSTLLRISRAHLLAFGWDHHEVIVRLLGGLVAQVRQGVDDAMALAFERIRDRVAVKLIELAVTQGEPLGSRTRIPLRLSQSMVAAMAGATRENANRAIRALMADGLIEERDGRYLVDAAGLVRSLGELPVRQRRNLASPESTSRM